MKKCIITLIFISIFLTVTNCWADDIDDVIISNKEFQMKKSFNLQNGINVCIHSVNPINISAFVSEILDSSDMSVEKIKSKFDENRIKNFSDEEIILSLKNPNNELDNTASGVTLLEQIIWWNNSNDYNYYWYAILSCHAADMFTYIISGSYHIYKYDSYYNTLDYLWTANTGAIGTWTLYGETSYKAFAGLGASSSNKADIVMNFYNGYSN